MDLKHEGCIKNIFLYIDNTYRDISFPHIFWDYDNASNWVASGPGKLPDSFNSQIVLLELSTVSILTVNGREKDILHSTYFDSWQQFWDHHH